MTQPQTLDGATALKYALGRIDALQENVAMILAQVIEKQSPEILPEGALMQIASQVLGTIREGDKIVRQHLGIEEPPTP